MRPVASLSLDLDNEWSYLRTHGDAGWDAFPSYLDRVVPRFLEVLDRLGLRITVFVVGQDAALPANRAALASLAAAGHEIGNHSLRHEPWLHLYTEEEIDAELAAAEAHLEAATGLRPRGFRGPGYSLSEATLRVLLRRGYAYDASTLPTVIGPLARAYYLATARLDPAERARRGLLFGSVRDGFRPLRPYRWRLGADSLLEIPVTTMPLARVPMHPSYGLYLSRFSPRAADLFVATGYGLCGALGVSPSVLLHPLDFLGPDDAPRLAFFPAMQIPAAEKIARVERWLARLARRFEVVPMGEHAARLAAGPALPLRDPDFAPAPPPGSLPASDWPRLAS